MTLVPNWVMALGHHSISSLCKQKPREVVASHAFQIPGFLEERGHVIPPA